MAVCDKDMPVAKSSIVLREEFDQWAIIFDPDTGDILGINPIGVYIWKRLDGTHTIQDILKEMLDHFENVPDEAKKHIEEFVQGLIERQFVRYKAQGT